MKLAKKRLYSVVYTPNRLHCFCLLAAFLKKMRIKVRALYCTDVVLWANELNCINTIVEHIIKNYGLFCSTSIFHFGLR